MSMLSDRSIKPEMRIQILVLERSSGAGSAHRNYRSSAISQPIKVVY